MAGTQQSRKVLILGASGKLGRMLCRLWQDKDFECLPVYRSGPGRSDALIWSPGDAFPSIEGVSAIVALWGVTPGPARDLSDNTRLAQVAMDLGEALGADTVLHCSSAAVYRPQAKPIDEACQPDPISPYGQAKRDMENAILARSDQLAARNIILRIGNVAGADSLFANMRPGAPITLDRFADGGSPARSYIAPQDLSGVVTSLLRRDQVHQIYNVAAPLPTAMGDIALAAGCKVTWRDAPEGAIPILWLGTQRLAAVHRFADDAHAPSYLVSGARAGGTWP